MKKKSSELKLLARQALAGKYGVAAGSILLLYAVIFCIVMVLEFVSVGATFGMFMLQKDMLVTQGAGMIAMRFCIMALLYFFTYMIMIGLIRMSYNICTNQKYGLKDLLFAFQNGSGKFMLVSLVLTVSLCGSVFGMFFITELFSTAGYFIYLILIMVISCVLTLNFAMTIYIMVENPERNLIDVLDTCFRIMKGNKVRLFLLGLSFLGWIILYYCTFGLNLLWFLPYWYCTVAEFYLDIKEPEEKEIDLMKAEGEFIWQPEEEIQVQDQSVNA